MPGVLTAVDPPHPRPPPVSSFSQHYPGNDSRYVKYLNDARQSVRESVIRSIETGKLSLHKKFPKSESLKDCMDRTIPFFTECITPDAIEPGKRVLISSSENAIRGLLMHLCEIPEEKITDLEIPNGLPLVFDTRSKCLKVSLLLVFYLRETSFALFLIYLLSCSTVAVIGILYCISLPTVKIAS